MVFMPPRHGKSMLVSHYFPAWYLGVFPERRILLASYAGSFAALWGRRARDVLREFGPEVYGVEIADAASAADRWELAAHGGGMSTAGAGGSLTGKGAHLMVIDDPVKNAEQAASARWQEKTWDWFQSTAYTRLEPGGAVVLVQTRWSKNDLAGRLLDAAEETGESWTVVRLPALAEPGDQLGRAEGEALWPARYSVDALRNIRATLGAQWWTALYQQQPIAERGTVFDRRWFRYWQPAGAGYRVNEESHRREDCWRFGTVDLALSERTRGDFTVAAIWACTPLGDLVLLDLVRERASAPTLVSLLRTLYKRWELDYLGVEKVGFQLAIVQELRREGLAVRGLVPRGDKHARASAAAVRFESGQVHFPRGRPWLDDFEAELLAFPHAAHDDQVDAVSYACDEVRKRYGGPAADRPQPPIFTPESPSTKGDADHGAE